HFGRSGCFGVTLRGSALFCITFHFLAILMIITLERTWHRMNRFSKKEKREMIAAAMKTLSEHKSLSPEAKDRGLNTLQKALERNTDTH
ncbi:MAG TPA: hypothetical protein DDW87_00710, partial [Firmicutes bacterium]|nr:hypothetical protein [Bacillota bacterium]